MHRLETSRAHRILWLLEELQVPYELKTYRRQKSMLADPALKDVHQLGKSPVVEIESPATSKPLVLAESGAIVEYLADHCGKWLIPKRYQEEEGKEDQIGGETENWLRHRFYMHYAEGSIMPLNVIGLLVQSEQRPARSLFCESLLTSTQTSRILLSHSSSVPLRTVSPPESRHPTSKASSSCTINLWRTS